MSLARLLYFKVKKSLVFLIGLALLGGAIAAAYTYYTRTELYRAELSFTVTNSSENMGGVSSILSQFGLPSAGNSQINLSKLAYLSRSNRIVNNVLLDMIEANGDSVRIIEIIFNEDLIKQDAKLEEEILNKESILLKGKVDYVDFDNIVTRDEKIVVKRCVKYLVGDTPNSGVVKMFYDDKSGIIELNVETPDEEFSTLVCNKFYQEIQDLYTRSEIEQRAETLDILSNKKDSLESDLASLNLRLGSAQDKLSSVPLYSSKARTASLNTKINVTLVAYGEVVRNYETASFVMQSSKPVFQIINYPIRPLSAVSDSWVKSGVVMSFAIGFLGVFLVIIYNLYVVFERG